MLGPVSSVCFTLVELSSSYSRLCLVSSDYGRLWQDREG